MFTGINKKKVALIISVIIVAVVAGGVTRSQLKARRHRQPAFTLVSRVTHFDPRDASRQLHGEETRYAFSDGSYRVIFTGEPGPDGKPGPKREYFFKYGAGFFEVDFKKQQLLKNSKMSPAALGRPTATAAELQADPQFNRIESLLGLQTYVMRITDEQTGQPNTDLYFAVETGPTPLKTIDYGRTGVVITIAEPIRIVFGEPNASLKDGPNFPIVESTAKP